MTDKKTATLTNLDRAEYGTITVDLDLLRTQLAWLQSLYLVRGDEADDAREGIVNLLEGIQDLADPEDNEGEADDETDVDEEAGL